MLVSDGEFDDQKVDVSTARERIATAREEWKKWCSQRRKKRGIARARRVKLGREEV